MQTTPLSPQIRPTLEPISPIKFFSLLLLLALHSTVQAANCLYVSSYHHGYEWNDGIERGIEEGLAGKCTLDKYFMDTKRNNNEEFIRESGLAAKAYIEKSHPDIVIACDDNASKYLVKPYYRDARLPIVFCGINWTVDEYGYPYNNVTGMIEVAPILPLLKAIQTILGKPSHGVYLSADNETERKDFERYRNTYNAEGVNLTGMFVKTMNEWKNAFVKSQSNPFVILNNNSGIKDWNIAEATQFVRQNSRALTVTNYDWMIPYSMIAMTKLPEEQGKWAAQVALAILAGEAPKSIPIVANRRWNIYVNPKLMDSSTYKLPAFLKQKAVPKE